jgi:hypothetical protein
MGVAGGAGDGGLVVMTHRPTSHERFGFVRGMSDYVGADGVGGDLVVVDGI